MDNISDKTHSFSVSKPWGSFFILLFFVFCGLFVGQLIGLVLVMLLFDFTLASLQDVILDATNHPEAKIPVFVIQTFTALGAFIIAPLLFMKIWLKKPASVFSVSTPISSSIFIITFLIVISFMFVNSLFVEWNAQLTLPEFMKPFENWAYEKEQQAKVLTEFLTSFDSFPQFLLGLVVIAIIPAIGEEMLFRGLIQNQIHDISKNIHVAIWATGFLFSAMHLQFYGLIPRMLLGVLFGYMYYWSGNLIIPIIAHFINNAFTLTMLYLYQIKSIEYDLETETSVPWYIVLSSLVVGTIMLFIFRKNFKQGHVTDG
ncbi:MAG: CPBP family intramembrane metalloprotease [Bacteroidota bacterium]|nr:CPBP family intramembrane metalloprotease [Bacteroidota bacterium]